MVDWSKVRTLSSDIKPMEKLVKGYSYVDRHSSVATDEKICNVIIQRIRESKNTLFNMIQLLFELEKKEPVSSHMQKLKDELDIFSDEIKVRHCEWKELDEKWSVELVNHDFDILKGLDDLNNMLQDLFEKIVKDKDLLSDSSELNESLWSSVKGELVTIEKQIDRLAKLFKEREGICNLKPISLEKTFKSIQDGIGKQI